MKKAILLLFLISSYVSLLNLSHAQTFQWLASMVGPNDDWVRDLEVDAEGNVYACGRIAYMVDFGGVPVTTYGGYDIFICKYNCQGNLVWVRTAGGFYDDYATGLALDEYGHVYMTGKFESRTVLPCTFFDTSISTNQHEMFLAKFDTSGNYLWGRFANRDTAVGLSEGYDLVMDSNGKPNVTIFSYPGTLFPGWVANEPNLVPYIARFDTSGIMESLFTPSADFSVGVYFNSMDSQDNYIINGSFYGDSALVGNQTLYNPKPGNYSMYVSKFSNAGVVQWVYMFDDTTNSPNNFSLSYGSAADAAGNIYVTGDVTSGIKCGNYIFTDSILPFSTSPFMIKLNPQGQPVWATQAHVQYQAFNMGGVAIKTNGNLIFSGTYGQLGVFGTDTLTDDSLGSFTDKNFFISEVDQNGNILGAVRLHCSNGYDIESYVTKVDSSNNVYIAGYFQGTLTAGSDSIQSGIVSINGFIAKYGYNCTTGISPTPAPSAATGISVWPNPIAGGAAVTFATAIAGGSYSVINMMGMEVATGAFQNGKGTISTQTLAIGVYTVVIHGQSNIGTARLVVVE